MSIKDRLTKKTADLVVAANLVPTETSTEGPPAAREAHGPLTAPGQMLAFRKQMQESAVKIHELEDRLSEFQDAAPVQRLDAKLIRPSKWANRHEYSFANASFADFKAEIEAAGGNVQPILVRKIDSADTKYEIAFGHRRHRACLELDLPVLAFISDLTDKELFSMMERENRKRADLSPFEQGEMYRRALDEGIFPSLRKLSSELSVDSSLVSKAITIARLPPDVLTCFESPTLIQYRWGRELSEAIQHDPEGTLLRAKELQRVLPKPSPRAVVDALLGKAKQRKAVSYGIERQGEVVARLVRKSSGVVDISFVAGVVSQDSLLELKAEIEKFLSEVKSVQ
jgi:ParB family transcriptional regulator, chromosome partitioning protein